MFVNEIYPYGKKKYNKKCVGQLQQTPKRLNNVLQRTSKVDWATVARCFNHHNYCNRC